MDALEGTVVDLPSVDVAMVGVGQAGLITDGSQLALLTDRLDGVVMLTEALNARSPVGQFTQFWRLFERAFRRGHRDAAPLMQTFLQGGPHGFEQAEIDEWVDKRNPAVHADRHQTPTLDSDVQRLMGRMREGSVRRSVEQRGVGDAQYRPEGGMAGTRRLQQSVR